MYFSCSLSSAFSGKDLVWRIEGTELKRSNGESVRGETSGIVGRWGILPDVEGRREMRGGVGKVISLMVIPASLSVNCTFRACGLDGRFGWRFGIAGGGRTGLGMGGTSSCAASRRLERLSRQNGSVGVSMLSSASVPRAESADSRCSWESRMLS